MGQARLEWRATVDALDPSRSISHTKRRTANSKTAIARSKARPHDARYSARSAPTGSALPARHAGCNVATIAIRSRIAATAAIAAGSLAAMP